ncbi:MAG TPA: hypothetical protein VG425_19480 [Casimicrobiaceae bacterium]|jgi:hypothetical protein|nr:hypothetical protein [Casimicrobiaceae bacterium]
MSIYSLRTALSLALLSLVVACASVPSPLVTTTWRDPNYNGPPFKKIFVVGLSARSLKDQRGFENLMVYALQGAGVTAVPGWQYVPTDRTPDQASMRAAIVQSGADAALLVRLSGFTTETTVGVAPDVVVPAASNMFVGWYEPGIVTESYQAATIYTTLFDVKTARPVWTFNPPTYNPATLEQDAPQYANEVARLLRSDGLLGGS